MSKKERTGIIYKATNKINGKAYVGQTNRGLLIRKQEHKRDSKKFDTIFYRAIIKYGWNNFKWEIIYKDIPSRQLNYMEKWAIANYGTYKFGYNSTTGGESYEIREEARNKISIANSKRIVSKQQREKLSKKNSGKNNPFYGKKHNKNTREKMRRPKSLETIKKISESKKRQKR